MFPIFKSLLQCLCQCCSVKIKLVCKIIEIVIILHPAGELHQAEDRIQLFGNSRFQRIGIDRRRLKTVKLRWYLPLFLSRHDDIPHTEINAKRSFCVLYPCYEGSANTGVLLCHSNGSHSFDFKCDKIVACFGCNNLLQYRLKLFRCIGHLSEQKIHISRNTAIEIREGIEKQSAFENQVFRIF